MTQLRYVGPFDEVTITCFDPATGGPLEVPAAREAVIDVPDWLAGAAPDGDDPGYGLLAQPGNWQPATTTRKKAADPAGDTGEDAP